MTMMASIHLMHVRHRAIYILHAAVGTQHTREVSLNIVIIVIVEPNRTELMSHLVDPQHSLQSRHGVDGTLGSPDKLKTLGRR